VFAAVSKHPFFDDVLFWGIRMGDGPRNRVRGCRDGKLVIGAAARGREEKPCKNESKYVVTNDFQQRNRFISSKNSKRCKTFKSSTAIRDLGKIVNS